MARKIILTLLIILNLLSLSSCIGIKNRKDTNRIVIGDEQKMDARVEQIISALKDSDKDTLKSLFSQKAVDESTDLDNELDLLFDYIQGSIESWEIEHGWSSSKSIRYGKTSIMIRFVFDVVTDVDTYSFFIIDYNVDTISPENEGVYMLEVHKSSYNGEWESWQKRMRAGISIVE